MKREFLFWSVLISVLIATGGSLTLAASDYGGSATTTELNFVHGVTSAIQTQLNDKQARPFASIAALKAVDGSNWSDGDMAIVSYDNSGAKELYFYIVDADGGASESSPNILVPDTTAGTINLELQAWWIDGVLQIKSIEVNALRTADLSDTTSPFALTHAEVCGHILTNSDTTGSSEWQFPALTGGENFTVMTDVAQNWALTPNDPTKWYLNGTALTSGEQIVDTSPTIGESVSCVSSYDSSGNHVLHCKSSDSDVVIQ